MSAVIYQRASGVLGAVVLPVVDGVEPADIAAAMTEAQRLPDLPWLNHVLVPSDHAAVAAVWSDPSRVTVADWADASSITVGPITGAALDMLRTSKIEAAWAELRRRLEVADVEVTTAAGTYAYGLDAVTQDNLQKAVLGVLLGSTPDPRPWMPRGETAPIMISHAEVTAIAAAVGAAYEAHMQAYLAHKAAIRALTTAAAVDAYDITAGWPANS